MRGIYIWIPWLLGALGALGFGWVGSRSGGGASGWGIAGALCSVAGSSILLGIANAATVPYSEAHWFELQWVASGVSATLIFVAVILAWFLSPYRAKTAP